MYERLLDQIKKIRVSLPGFRNDFYELYMELLVILQKYSEVGLHKFNLYRVPDPVGIRGVTPQQIKFFRIYSQILQGTYIVPTVGIPKELQMVRPPLRNVVKGDGFIMFPPD
jgi:hypothetical protein